MSRARGTRDLYQWGSSAQGLAWHWQMVMQLIRTLSVTPCSTELFLWKDSGTAFFFFFLKEAFQSSVFHTERIPALDLLLSHLSFKFESLKNLK